MAEDKGAASPKAKDERATGPGTVSNDAEVAADGHLGASDKDGKPRSYAENALDTLDTDPMPKGGKDD